MGKWISIVCFNMLVGISPTGVALEPSRFVINFRTSSSFTLQKENFSVVLLIGFLIFSILRWDSNALKISSRLLSLPHW